MTVKEPGFCFGLWVLGATVGLPFTTTISQKKKIVGRIPRRGFYLLILVCFFRIQICSKEEAVFNEFLYDEEGEY